MWEGAAILATMYTRLPEKIRQPGARCAAPKHQGVTIVALL